MPKTVFCIDGNGHLYVIYLWEYLPENKPEECNEVAGLNATFTQQTAIDNFFPKIELSEIRPWQLNFIVSGPSPHEKYLQPPSFLIFHEY